MRTGCMEFGDALVLDGRTRSLIADAGSSDSVLSHGLVSQVGVQQFQPPLQPSEVPAERILPNEPQAGEEESAALLL